MPLPVTEAECSCGAPLDPQRRDRAACTFSGLLKKRATPIERMVARIFREAVDVTLRSALTRDGEPQPNAAEDGAVLVQARHDKENTFPGLVASERCRLVVPAIETGGLWSEEAVNVLHQLAVARAREVPAYMSHQVALACERRWTRMLASTCAVAFATSLVAPSRQCDTWCHAGGEAPGSVICSLLTRGRRFMCPGWTLDVSCCDPAFSLCFEKNPIVRTRRSW